MMICRVREEGKKERVRARQVVEHSSFSLRIYDTIFLKIDADGMMDLACLLAWLLAGRGSFGVAVAGLWWWFEMVVCGELVDKVGVDIKGSEASE